MSARALRYFRIWIGVLSALSVGWIYLIVFASLAWIAIAAFPVLAWMFTIVIELDRRRGLQHPPPAVARFLRAEDKGPLPEMTQARVAHPTTPQGILIPMEPNTPPNVETPE